MDVWAVGACICIIVGIIAFIISLEEDDFMFFFMSSIFFSMGAACVILCGELKYEKIKQSINEAENIYIKDRYHIRIDGDNVYLETK